MWRASSEDPTTAADGSILDQLHRIGVRLELVRGSLDDIALAIEEQKRVRRGVNAPAGSRAVDPPPRAGGGK